MRSGRRTKQEIAEARERVLKTARRYRAAGCRGTVKQIARSAAAGEDLARRTLREHPELQDAVQTTSTL